jgi:hypothetical protein
LFILADEILMDILEVEDRYAVVRGVLDVAVYVMDSLSAIGEAVDPA